MKPKQLRDWREVRGLSQTELAAKLGMAWQTISNYERGVTTPIPLQFRYALAALDRGLKPYGGDVAPGGTRTGVAAEKRLEAKLSPELTNALSILLGKEDHDEEKG